MRFGWSLLVSAAVLASPLAWSISVLLVWMGEALGEGSGNELSSSMKKDVLEVKFGAGKAWMGLPSGVLCVWGMTWEQSAVDSARWRLLLGREGFSS